MNTRFTTVQQSSFTFQYAQLFCLVLFACFSLQGLAQRKRQGVDSSLVGSYETDFSKAYRFNVVEKDSALFLQVVGQGTVPLKPSGDGMYTPEIVKPEAKLRFVTGGADHPSYFLWNQNQRDLEWKRTKPDTALVPDTSSSAYSGRYVLPNLSIPLWISENPDGSLRSLVFSETPLQFLRISERLFEFQKNDFKIVFEFSNLKNGKYQKIKQTRSGPLRFVKTSNGEENYYKTIPTAKSGFTRADTLQGTLSPLRSCFDVLFYNLDIRLDPVNRYLSGSNLIRFRANAEFNQLQIDLVRNLNILKITWQNHVLPFTREENAVFVSFPESIPQNSIGEIVVEYAGYPQPGDIPSLSGGFLWTHDRNGNDWIQVVTQGTGASVWWPCKDHLSDEPDSMQINITLPKHLTNVSNGALRKQTLIGDSAIRSEWFVSYPINIYNVTLNIGDYRKLSWVQKKGEDSLALNFYYLPYNLLHATKLFEEFKLMNGHASRLMGPYPFKRDGFTMLEAPYPMEHQGAVSIGSINNPITGSGVNYDGLISMIWHEGGHEWWGNNVSMSDNADIWFHEAFTTYFELMNIEMKKGKKELIKKLFDDLPSNDDKMVGEYGVNHFKLNSVYSKGALMLHTLRNILSDDSLFFGLWKGIQHDFAFKTSNADSIINYICRFTGKSLQPFFNQYLRYPAIPKLEIQSSKNPTTIRYRWSADVNNFSMPVRLLLPGDKALTLDATDRWQEVVLKTTNLSKLKIDKEHFYADMVIIK